ncbi:MAG TPA: malectin domain-containing carbohydrate-binding protein [Myxococcota bacterium]|nr:malectin domain-containing carbohydrate-binding protein [Myxococcota bacterium]
MSKTASALIAALAAGVLFAGAPVRAEHPSNGWIVWASDRQDSRHEIYMMKADGTGVARLTTTGALMPMWSPDGRWIAYQTVPLGETRVMRWDKSEDKKIFDGLPMFWLWDGTRIICMDSNDDLYRVDPESGGSSFWLHRSDFSQMADKSWSPSGLTADGRWLVTWTDRYRNGYSGNNGTFDAYHAAVILDLQNKGDVWFVGSGCEPTTPPGGDWMYHVCGGLYCDTHPDVFQMKISDRQSRSSYTPVVAHADADWGHEYFPRISTDGNWLTYGATTGCHDHDTCDYEIFIHPLSGNNDNRERLTSDPHNDQWPHLYIGELWGSQPPELTSIEVVAADPSIVSGGSTDLTANSKDQNGDPIASDMNWSVSGGGSMNPAADSQSASQHTSTFTSDGNSGTFVVTAESGGIQGTATIEVVSTALPIRINCGSNDHDVAGWLRDDAFVSGGSDYTNPDSVDTTGVVNAAPAEVYKSVRHESPHSYDIDVPDGVYLLRLHFADKFTNRSMNYFAEGSQILTDFDISSEAGGSNRALVKDFQVTVADGNGLQIEAQSDADVFEAGIEVTEWVDEEPQPDGDGSVQPDGDGNTPADADGGQQIDADGGQQADDDAGPQADADSGTLDGADGNITDADQGAQADSDEEIVVSGGCAGCSSSSTSRGGLIFLLLLGLLVKLRPQARKPKSHHTITITDRDFP